MAERSPVDPFEQRLSGLIRTYTQPAAATVDHLATARAAMTTRPGRWASVERRWRLGVDRRLVPLVVLAAMVLLAMMALALAGGSAPKPPLDTTSRLLFVRDGDLFVSRLDGTGATMIRDGDAADPALGYLGALWSPDMGAIAAVRDTGGPVLTPVVDILDPSGGLERTIEAAGGTPSISWSPDSRELAITTYPAEVGRYSTEPTSAPMGLTIAGRNGSSREIQLPEAARADAYAEPGAWTVPDFGVRWSPDGRWIAVPWLDPSGLHHLVAADGSSIVPLFDTRDGDCQYLNAVIDWFPDGTRLTAVDSAGAAKLCVVAVGPDGAGDEPAIAIATTAPDVPGSGNAPARHEKFGVPVVSPAGDRIALSMWVDSFDEQRHETVLRVYDVASGDATDVASGVEKLVVDSTGAARATDVLEGNPVGTYGFGWTGDGGQLLYLSGEGTPATSATLRAVDASGGPSSIVAEGVRSFDIGYAH